MPAPQICDECMLHHSVLRDSEGTHPEVLKSIVHSLQAACSQSLVFGFVSSLAEVFSEQVILKNTGPEWIFINCKPSYGHMVVL